MRINHFPRFAEISNQLNLCESDIFSLMEECDIYYFTTKQKNFVYSDVDKFSMPNKYFTGHS